MLCLTYSHGPWYADSSSHNKQLLCFDFWPLIYRYNAIENNIFIFNFIFLAEPCSRFLWHYVECRNRHKSKLVLSINEMFFVLFLVFCVFVCVCVCECHNLYFWDQLVEPICVWIAQLVIFLFLLLNPKVWGLNLVMKSQHMNLGYSKLSCTYSGGPC